MKKAICVFLLIILVCVLCFAFAACSKPATDSSIKLTLTNYSEYIAVNLTFGSNSSPNTMAYEYIPPTRYNYIGYISTSRKQNVHFQNVKITFNCGGKVATAELDYDGSSTCSFGYETTSQYVPNLTAHVRSISGYVIVS